MGSLCIKPVRVKACGSSAAPLFDPRPADLATRPSGVAVQAARDFYHSAAYQNAREKRLTAAELKMTLLEGVPERRDGPPQRVSTMKSVPLPVS